MDKITIALRISNLIMVAQPFAQLIAKKCIIWQIEFAFWLLHATLGGLRLRFPLFANPKSNRANSIVPLLSGSAAQEIMIWDWLSAEMHAHFLPFPPSHGQMPNWIWYIGRTIIGRQICFPPSRGAGRGQVGVQPPSCRSSAAPTWRTCACRGTWERGWWSMDIWIYMDICMDIWRYMEIFFSLSTCSSHRHARLARSRAAREAWRTIRNFSGPGWSRRSRPDHKIGSRSESLLSLHYSPFSGWTWSRRYRRSIGIHILDTSSSPASTCTQKYEGGVIQIWYFSPKQVGYVRHCDVTISPDGTDPFFSGYRWLRLNSHDRLDPWLSFKMRHPASHS